MAWAKISKENAYYINGFRVEGASEYLADSEADVKSLPRDTSVGSACTCIKEGSTWIFGPCKDGLKYGGVSIKAGDGSQY